MKNIFDGDVKCHVWFYFGDLGLQMGMVVLYYGYVIFWSSGANLDVRGIQMKSILILFDPLDLGFNKNLEEL